MKRMSSSDSILVVGGTESVKLDCSVSVINPSNPSFIVITNLYSELKGMSFSSVRMMLHV